MRSRPSAQPRPERDSAVLRDHVRRRSYPRCLSAGHALSGTAAHHHAAGRPDRADRAAAPARSHCDAAAFPHYGLEHIGLTVDDVDAAVEELRARGAEIAIGPLTRNPGLRLAFIRGPEGIMIELVQR